MNEARYVKVPLDQVFVYKNGDFKNWWTPKYGESLGKIIYDYTMDPSIEIFDRNKEIIKDGFLEYDKSKLKQRNFFFYRFEKILRLLEYWIDNGKWRDPIVITYQGHFVSDNAVDLKYVSDSGNLIDVSLEKGKEKKCYFVSPGTDRYLIMKAMGVQEYDFLEINRDFIRDENFDKIRSHWGEHWENLSISHNKDTNHYGLHNKDNIETILKFQKTIGWLQNHKSIIEYLTK